MLKIFKKILCFFVFAVLLLSANMVFAATKTWGAGTGLGIDGKWSTAANWTGDAKPIAGDDVVFNNVILTNCAIDEAPAILGTLILSTGYTGTITQSFTTQATTVTFTAGTWTGGANFTCTSLTVDGGTVTFSNSTDVNGNISRTSGSLTLTSGNTNISGGLSGTFTHNSGTVIFDGVGITATIDSASDFYNFTDSVNGGTITVSQDINVTNNILYTSTTSNLQTWNGSNINARKDITFQAYQKIVGTTKLKINGSGNQTLTGNGDTNYGYYFNLPLSIESTGGTVYFSNAFNYAGTWTHISGTVDTSTNTSTVVFCGATSSLTSNTMEFYNVRFELSNATLTLADNLIANKTTYFGNTSTNTQTINGNKIYAKGDITFDSGSNQQVIAGTTAFEISGGVAQIFTGNGANSSSRGFALPIIINKSGDTLTLASYQCIKGGWTYTAGTVDPGTSTIISGAAQNINANGMSFYNFTSASASTITLLSNLSVDGTFLISNATVINGAFNVNTSANITLNAALSGTSLLNYDGTGTWSGNNAITNNMTINTAGTLSLSGSIKYGGGTFTYIGGTVSASTSTLTFNTSCTINAVGINFNNVTFIGSGQTYTLSSNLSVDGNIANNIGSVTLNGSNLYASASVTHSNTFTGTTKLILDGTGTLSGAGSLIMDTDINTAGTITLNGGIAYGAKIFDYIAGTVVTTGNTLTTSGSTLKLNGMSLNNLTISTGTTTLGEAIDINGVLTINASRTLNAAGYQTNCAGNWVNNGIFTAGNNTVVFDGTSTLSGATTFYNLTLAAGSTEHLTSTQTFTVAGTFNAIGTSGSPITLDAVTGGSRALLPVTTLGTVSYVTATDIDSSGGVTVIDKKGTLSNTINWSTGLSAMRIILVD
jgi:fibronectin-binding autotransporter adhesin